MQIEPVSALELDLDTADRMAAIAQASLTAAGVPVPAPSGPALLGAFQQGSDCRPVDDLWLAREGDDLVGYGWGVCPWRDNTDVYWLRGYVHPEHRRQGTGRALVELGLASAHARGRPRVSAHAWSGCAGMLALPALGFSSDGLGVSVVRRLDLHEVPFDRWQRLYDEASAHASDYELVRQRGSTPQGDVPGMLALHEAINDAPVHDPDHEDDVWDVTRLEDYERAMQRRRQTLYRVMARHRPSGDWAGMSMLLVDEFAPRVAEQEDTSVVRAHRGHRLGLLMKADMLRWIAEERPEIAATDTWNDATNHHMIAVNERLGTRVVAQGQAFRHRG